MTDTKAIRKKLAALRISYGHDSPIGHRCANLMLMLDRLPHYRRQAWTSHRIQHLPDLIEIQLASIEELSRNK